jgi:hypothetical protein
MWLSKAIFIRQQGGRETEGEKFGEKKFILFV